MLGFNDMDDTDDNDSGSDYLIVGGFVVGIPLLYVLSVGPALWLSQKMGWSEDAFVIFYYPLIKLHEHTFLRHPLDWYVGLFGF